MAARSYLLSVAPKLVTYFVAFGLGGFLSNVSIAADRGVSSVPEQIERSARKSERVRLGYSGPSMGNIPLLMAAKKRLFS